MFMFYLKRFRCLFYLFIIAAGEDTAEGDDFNYKTMLERDEERWRMADVDKDNMLDFEQFSAFLHPEDVSHMQDVVVKVRK